MALVLGVGCANEACQSESGEAPTTDAQLLAHDDIYELDHDGLGYRAIGQYWRDAALPIDVRREKLDLGWPLRGDARAVFQRLASPVAAGPFGYYHTALDVIRADASASDEVLAPATGLAMVFDWHGKPGRGADPYATVVAVYDASSHAVLQLMHVAPTAALADAAQSGPVPVRRGDVLGSLARVPIETTLEPSFRHTHVNVVDVSSSTLLDAATLLDGYRDHDHASPTIGEIYALDELGQRSGSLVTGRLDLVVEAFDRDDDSGRNLSPSAIGFEVVDASGHAMRSLPRCELAHLVDSLAELPRSFRATDVVDFAGRTDVDGTWPRSDIGNRDRRFRYAITQLAVDDAGRCHALEDGDGFVDVPDTLASLEVRVTVWDPSGRATNKSTTIVRDPKIALAPRVFVAVDVEGATTSPGESVYVCGDDAALGAWDRRRCAKLRPTSYPTWSGGAFLPVGETVRFKLTKQRANGAVIWESGDDRSYVVPSTPSPRLAVRWR